MYRGTIMFFRLEYFWDSFFSLFSYYKGFSVRSVAILRFLNISQTTLDLKSRLLTYKMWPCVIIEIRHAVIKIKLIQTGIQRDRQTYALRTGSRHLDVFPMTSRVETAFLLLTFVYSTRYGTKTIHTILFHDVFCFLLICLQIIN